jgi:exonuclease III
MVSQQMKHLIKNAGIMPDAMHSDHCPCFVELLL